MSVIVSRAPDVRDGLKAGAPPHPVCAMHGGYTHDKPYRKSAQHRRRRDG
jgi:DNA gyrase/topoisomerase IV subunit A